MDTKYDWGFLNFDSGIKLLRTELAYNKPILYQTAIGLNIFLRVLFVFSLSVHMSKRLFNSEIAILFIGIGEFIRLAIWNLLS